jgi:hypothetical protein
MLARSRLFRVALLAAAFAGAPCFARAQANGETATAKPSSPAPVAKKPAANKSVSAKKPSTTTKVAATKAPAKAKAATSKRTPAKTSKSAAKPASPVTPVASPAPEPAATNPEPPLEVARPAPPPAAPSASVVVPSSDHVHVSVPPGLQHWLDEDDRMRPWLAKALAAADGCYAELRNGDPSASGTIVFTVTMHQNARPSASVSSVPTAIRGLVLCVTTRLLSVKMPLFTGDEGATYSVRVSFDL